MPPPSAAPILVALPKEKPGNRHLGLPGHIRDVHVQLFQYLSSVVDIVVVLLTGVPARCGRWIIVRDIPMGRRLPVGCVPLAIVLVRGTPRWQQIPAQTSIANATFQKQSLGYWIVVVIGGGQYIMIRPWRIPK